MSKTSSSGPSYEFHGTMATTTEVTRFIEHIISANTTAEAGGRRKTPVCIWGRHGIGKTELVQAIAKRNGWAFSYVAPAQFEEMGDLVGMPQVEDGVTRFRAPEWVPTEKGPGILLIDDVNRADDRILRGIMQLLQNFELVSWKLPEGWQIVLTANPEGGDYSVTPMDDAMLTRMMHVSMQFDVKAWARWADEANVDPRGINFILTYPELVSGNRTTPRTLVQFFEAIQPIDDLAGHLPLVQMLADGCLDRTTATAFVTYVQQRLSQLITPAEILKAKDFGKTIQPLKDQVTGATMRVDILATVCTRLVTALTRERDPLTVDKKAVDNLKAFILLEWLPNDLRLSMARDLVQARQPKLKLLMADKQIAKLLLKKM